MRLSIALTVTIVVALLGIQVLASPLVESTTTTTQYACEVDRVRAREETGTITCALPSPSFYRTETRDLEVQSFANPQVKGFAITSALNPIRVRNTHMVWDAEGVTAGDISVDSSGQTLSIEVRAIVTLRDDPGQNVDGHLTVSYLTEDLETGTGVNAILLLIPFLVLIGVITGTLATTGYKTYGALQGEGGGSIGDVLVLVVGVVMIPVIIVFLNGARDTYEVTPEFTGVSTVLGLVLIGYVLNLVAQGVVVAAPAVRSVRG